MAVPREQPYIWTTWLPRQLTGENSCEWAVWFKAHHQNWAKVPSDFNQAEWMLNHTSLLNEKKSHWEARRQHVYVEGQNSFRLRGQSATLAGRPDLIVVRSNDALIIDVKAGRQQPSHFVQIMIYMYALPRALQQYQHAKLAGEVVYPTRTARVPMGSLHTQFKMDLGALNPPDRRGQASRKGAQRTRMPLLRHHRRGLPGARENHRATRRRNDTRFLDPPPSHLSGTVIEW